MIFQTKTEIKERKKEKVVDLLPLESTIIGKYWTMYHLSFNTKITLSPTKI